MHIYIYIYIELVPRRPTWLSKASQVPQDETQMASKMASTYVLASWILYYIIIYYNSPGLWP